jgi:hypothetical protein
VSSDFVRYAPEIETIDPDIDETLAQIIDYVEKKGRESPRTEGAGRAVRAAHANPVISARTPKSDPASASRSKSSMLTESSW